MSRDHLNFVAILATNCIGVAAVAGILFALMTGNDYHPLVVLGAFFYLLLRPLLSWIESRTKKNASKNIPQ